MKQVMMVLMTIIVSLALVFGAKGVVMHERVKFEEVRFHELQRDYYGSHTKDERESAEAGSDLNRQLAAINNYPSELLRLKLVGIGKILAGIFFLLIGILMALMIMPHKLGLMLNKKKRR